MNELDFTNIEQQLKISLPASYKALLLSKFSELQASGAFDDDLSCLFLNAELVIHFNLSEREEDMGTQYAFPGWWKTFFLFGTNGAGDYYSLKLDGSPEVWMIGSDCGDEATEMDASIEEFVDRRMADHIAEVEARRQLERERAEGRAPFDAEFNAHRQAVADAGGLDVAEAWFGANSYQDIVRALDHMPFKVSIRKLRLAGIAACKRIEDCRNDQDLAEAIELAERLTLGTVTVEEIQATRASLLQKREQLETSKQRWLVSAVYNLLQDDNEYKRTADYFPNNPELVSVLAALGYVLYGRPQGTIAECQPIWEVLGFPFLEVKFDPTWRSAEVVSLAAQMFDTQDFSQMPKMAELLMQAGCNDQRIITHCQRTTGHLRGSWVLDLILEKEPNPFAGPFSWDFEWRHSTIEASVIKERIKQFGVAVAGSVIDDSMRLQFADWLEQHGDQAWAEFIRVRCALDGRAPSDDYADLLERQTESEIDLGKNINLESEGVYIGYELVPENWWSLNDYYRGLPSVVHAVSPGDDSAGPPSVLAQRIGAIMQQTPVRGVNFEDEYAEDMDEILQSSHLSSLQHLDLENKGPTAEASPVIKALAQAEVAQKLEVLGLENGIRCDDEALLLAGANLNSLERLDMKYGKIECSAAAAQSLMSSAWFRKLGQLHCGLGIGEACAEVVMRELLTMTQLHSLAIDRLPVQSILAIADGDEFPALRRLSIRRTKLCGDTHEAFCKLRAPKLIDLVLSSFSTKQLDAKLILKSPLFEGLQTLSLRDVNINKALLSELAKHPCASRLRMLELDCGDSNLNGKFSSLGETALAGNAFSSLTTLKILNPYTSKAQGDTAKMLKQIMAPNLRHLSLDCCDFDDECAEAIRTNPSFAKLTRLSFSQRYKKEKLLTPAATEALFRCDNLQNMVLLECRQAEIGDSLLCLSDRSVMPRLKSGAFWGTRSSAQTQALLEEKRDEVYISG